MNLTVTYVGLGHGIQNYTCASENATAIGALAVIYDITPLYPGMTSISLSAEDFNGLSANVLWNSAIPLNWNHMQCPRSAIPHTFIF
jgi:hypothetical protein